MLLLRYLDEDFARATPEHRDAFARILELQDPDIFGYLLGRDTPAEASLLHVVARIRRVDA